MSIQFEFIFHKLVGGYIKEAGDFEDHSRIGNGFALELCVQGLVLWLDDQSRWQWYWQETEFKSAQGFWAIGEAVVDAVIGRYPETFATEPANDG